MSTIMKNLIELTEKNLELTEENERLKKEVVFHMKAAVATERELEEVRKFYNCLRRKK